MIYTQKIINIFLICTIVGSQNLHAGSRSLDLDESNDSFKLASPQRPRRMRFSDPHNQRDENGNTPLYNFIRHLPRVKSDHPAEIRIILKPVNEFLEQGIDINASNQDGLTALMGAVIEGAPWVLLAYLIRYNADINAQDMHGNTPLMVALYTNNLAAIHFLLQEKADPYIRNNRGLDALMIAQELNNTEALALLTANHQTSEPVPPVSSHRSASEVMLPLIPSNHYARANAESRITPIGSAEVPTPSLVRLPPPPVGAGAHARAIPAAPVTLSRFTRACNLFSGIMSSVTLRYGLGAAIGVLFFITYC